MVRLATLRTIAVLCGSAAAGFLCGLLLVALFHLAVAAHESPELWSAVQEPNAAPATSTVRVFGADAGMVLNFVKPEKTGDFEAIMGKLREALQKSDKPERKQQAASWKVFRALEPAANGSVLYIFEIDPAVKGADYTVSTILAEGFPTEVQALYKQYAEAYASGQNFVNLRLVAALGQ